MWLPILLVSGVVLGQNSFSPQAGQFSLAGYQPGDQVFPHVSVRPGGGFVVWQDNQTDGDGWGISAQALNNSLSGSLSTFRVNEQGAGQQENPRVGLLQNGGAVFAWQGGQQGFQKIWARFLAPDGTFATGDLMVNTYTNQQQINPSLAVLTNGTIVVAWASFGQDGNMQGVFAQRLSSAGQKLGAEFQVNQTTALNQRTPAVAAMANGGFVLTWVSESQRGYDLNGGEAYGVDIYARLYDANGAVLGGEFKVNSGLDICANPAVSAAVVGGFTVAWGQRDGLVRSNGWDIFARAFDVAGAPLAADVRVNSFIYGDQFAPKIESLGSSHLIVWTSLGQDGSREGVYGRVLTAGGALSGSEFLVNTVTIGSQLHPAVASDGETRFLVVWASYMGGTQFDLFAQRYASTQTLPTLTAPSVSALSGSRLAISWAELAGYNVANYAVYVDGSATPVTTTNNYHLLSGLSVASAHSFRVEYVLTDGRRGSLSGATTARTWGDDLNFDGLPDDWQARYWGPDPANWPGPNEDSDGDGATNLQEFLAGTDPTDAKSVLRLSISNTAQGLRLNWNTQPGVVYQVQTAPTPRNWVNLGKPRFAAGASDSIPLERAGETVMFRIIRVR